MLSLEDERKQETVEAILNDLGAIGNVCEEHAHECGEYFYLRGWRRNDIEEKYESFAFDWTFKLFLILSSLWCFSIVLEKVLFWFGIVI